MISNDVPIGDVWDVETWNYKNLFRRDFINAELTKMWILASWFGLNLISLSYTVLHSENKLPKQAKINSAHIIIFYDLFWMLLSWWVNEGFMKLIIELLKKNDM